MPSGSSCAALPCQSASFKGGGFSFQAVAHVPLTPEDLRPSGCVILNPPEEKKALISRMMPGLRDREQVEASGAAPPPGG